MLHQPKSLCELVSDLHDSAREIVKSICATGRKCAVTASDAVVDLVARSAG